MTHPLHILQNDHWQVGILPSTGASVAFARIQHGGDWLDFMRPTAPEHYDNASLCASFLLIPWSNRIQDARFTFQGEVITLHPNTPEGFAMHGAVRKVPWKVAEASETFIRLTYTSTDYDAVNWPFAFSAEATYALDGADLVMGIALTNEDSRPFPAGFGHHPYFVRTMPVDGQEAIAHVRIPGELEYEMVNKLTVAAPFPITPEIDFRTLRPIQPESEAREIDHVLTGVDHGEPVTFAYGTVTVTMSFDPIFGHIVFFAPLHKPYFAIEPVTNTNDGFNLAEQGVPHTGVFTLYPGERRSGEIRLKVGGG